jgi:DNA polymerase-1
VISLYKRTIINTNQGLETLISEVARSEGWLAFDTETTGLHLKKDTPFLITLTFNNKSYALEIDSLRRETLQKLFDKMSVFEYVFGHNIKFDLHMLANIGIHYKGDNLADTMTVARLALDTDEVMTIALKSLSKRYLYEDAGEDEKIVKTAITNIKRSHTAYLKNLIKEAGKTKKWFDNIVSDTIFEMADLGDFEETYRQYLKDYPEPTYKDVFKDPLYKEAMLAYAMKDTELTIEIAKKMYPSLIAKNQSDIFKLESNLILPLFRMERVGLNVDREYIETSRIKTREYIIYKRRQLCELVGETIKVGQHKRIKDLFKEKWGVVLQSSDDRALAGVSRPGAQTAAETIRELRTLEKWYSAYILRLLDKSAFDGRAYTQINQSAANTGRVSSDFQQFPKHAMYDDNNQELFHPRRAIITTGNGYDNTYYLDYSQIELRVQANYTFDISGGDLNMCRAYMPFKCHNASGKKFDPLEDKDLTFKEKWLQDENNAVWKPIDLHSATTMEAFPEVDTTTPEFKELRALGKATNFAKNYGATAGALMTQFGFTKDVARKMDEAYYKAFPKILDYQKLVRDSYTRRGFVKNRYGRRYYLGDRRFVYKLYNYIIQGTCADMLKEKIIEVDSFLKPYKTRFQMNIHDELSFEVYKGEEFLIPTIKKMMEDVDWMTVPVVADVEVTHTNWAEKEAVR